MKHDKRHPWKKRDPQPFPPAHPAPTPPSQNAVKHGACAFNTLILPTESDAAYQALESRCFKLYSVNPHHASEGECELIRAAARAEWFFLRAERNYAQAEARITTEIPDILAWTSEQHQNLQRFLRYKTANFNSLIKARKEIENYRQTRRRESAHAQLTSHRDQRMTMAKERLEIHREKNKPFDFEEEIETMRKKAIRLGYLPPEPAPAG